jgi:pyruvate/2-oxoglutarate dehydrogenase complex dihydrolipoamide acyltransferase (E2) component
MREHGVHVEQSTAGGPTRIRGGTKESGPSLHTLEAAQRACNKYSPGAAAEAKLTPAQKVAQEEAVQKFAKCMREHGIELEAHSSTAGGGLAIRIGIHHQAGEGGPNPSSPAFQAAQKACQSLLPGPAGASKGAFPKGPPPKGAGEESKSGPASSAGG